MVTAPRFVLDRAHQDTAQAPIHCGDIGQNADDQKAGYREGC
jgi:hypothetical protein